jgi:TRAP-type C4-dicarboxylate transport system substrate-binding protein
MEMKSSCAKIAVIGMLFLGLIGAIARPGKAGPADKITVKLGTLAPKGSSFEMALKEMGQKWRDASGGSINLVIYPDGTQGGETEMVQKMRSNSLGAGMLTVVGLSNIEKSVGGLSFLPLTFRSWSEYDYVLGKIGPKLEKMLLDKGFVVLFWGDAGWLHYFSKAPVLFPGDLKSMKLFTWAGDAFQVDVMKSLGYNPIPLETADILPSLRTGMIDAISLPSTQALAGQIYSIANNMLSLNWSVLSGGTIIKKELWNKISPDMQKKLMEAAAAAGAKMRDASRKEDECAIKAMQAKGLKVNVATPQVEQEWYKLTSVVYPKIRGKMVPDAIFDEVQQLVREFRASHGAGK